MMVEKQTKTGPVLTQGPVPMADSRPAPLLKRIAGRVLPGSAAVLPDLMDVESFSATSRRSFPIGIASFILFVVVPAILVACYFSFIASNQFAAETRFVVRMGPQDGNGITGQNISAMIMSAAGGGKGMTGGTSSLEDAQIVANYVHSRAMVDDLSRVVSLREMFTRPEADFYARLRSDATVDELVDYWKSMVTSHVEGTSGVVTIGVRAFRPDDAARIAQSVQEQSEKLVNAISTRARQDALQRASDEVRRAQTLLIEAVREVELVQNEEGMIDPVLTATENGKILTRLLTEKLTTENQLLVAKGSLSGDSQSVRLLQARFDALSQQVAEWRARIAGSDGQRNLAKSIGRFEQVAVKQKMAETLYGLAEGGLDRARRTAEAQSVYLSVFVPPALPEEHSYPRRLAFSIVAAVSLLVLWSIVALVWATVQDHRLT